MIYVVTAVHNRKDITEKFLQQLMQQIDVRMEIILVDDGSTDGTEEMVKERFPQVNIIKGNGSLWWGGSLQKAYRWLKKNGIEGSFVFISNDDVIFKNDYIKRMVEKLKVSSRAVVSGVGIGDISKEIVDCPIKWDFRKFAGQKTLVCGEANCISTRSVMLRIEDLKNIGGFHPFLLPHYGSDYEWSIRACKKGYKIVTAKNLTYTILEDYTGYRDRKKMSFKQMFSKKSNINPFYRVTFLILITPINCIFDAFLSQIMRIKK